MSEQQGILTAPLAVGANLGFAYTTVPWNGTTAYALPNTLRDPITGAGAFVTGSNALKVDGSGVVQPVAVQSIPSLPAGTNQIGSVIVSSGSVSISGTPTVSANVSNFPADYGPGQNSNGNGLFVPTTDTTVEINCAVTSSQTLVTGVPGKRIYVTAFVIMASEPSTGAGTVQFVDSTTSTGISGQMAVTPETGISIGTGVGAVFVVAPGDSLEIVTATGASVQGFLSYTQV